MPNPIGGITAQEGLHTSCEIGFSHGGPKRCQFSSGRFKTSNQLLPHHKSYTAVFSAAPSRSSVLNLNFTSGHISAHVWHTFVPFLSPWLRVCCNEDNLFPVVREETDRGHSQREKQEKRKCWLRHLSICLSATGHACRNAPVCSFNHSCPPGFKWAETSYREGHIDSTPRCPLAFLISTCLLPFFFFFLNNNFCTFMHHKGLGHFSLKLFYFPRLLQERPAPM